MERSFLRSHNPWVHRLSKWWELVRSAAGGQDAQREEFARRYGSVIRSCLAVLWTEAPPVREVERGVQEVLSECFREEGVLHRAARDQEAALPQVLYGVVCSVAKRLEPGQGRRRPQALRTGLGGAAVQKDPRGAFDRAWGRAVVREAVEVQRARAHLQGSSHASWVEILRMRFEEEVPLEEIARRWKVDPAWLQREYVHARRAFRESLLLVVARYAGGTRQEIEEECRRLLGAMACGEEHPPETEKETEAP